MVSPASTSVLAWRHPRPQGAEGRCIGRTDLPVDRRKAKRLAHRIRQEARRHGLPRVIHTSTLQRCAAVGRCLRTWGWRHHIDPRLQEMDFGRWDGQRWADIAQDEVDAWCADFLQGRPGGGERLTDVFDRVAAWLDGAPKPLLDGPRLVVAHAGWMLVLHWLCTRSDRPLQASQWPAPPAYGHCWALTSRLGGQ